MGTREIALTDESGKSLTVKLATGGFLLSVPNAQGGRTNAFIPKQQAKLLLLYLREHVEAS